MQFSGLAADLWSQKLVSVEDQGPFIAAFAKNVFFAEDLGIDTIRVDTVEPITVIKEKKLDPKPPPRVETTPRQSLPAPPVPPKPADPTYLEEGERG